MPIVTLPKSSLVYMDDEKIEINILAKYIKKINYKNIEKAKGLLKNMYFDPIKYQRTLRDEWE